MSTETIILIITNIVVSIAVAIITGAFQSKKYRKEIELINAEHEHKIQDMQKDFEHQIEILKIQHENELEKLRLENASMIELENQKTNNQIISGLANRVSDAIMDQPATRKLINQQTTQRFLQKKKK